MWPRSRRDIFLRTGPFRIHLETSDDRVVRGVTLLYGDRRLSSAPAFCDFHVSLDSPIGRRWFRPKSEFLFDGLPTAKPGPRRHALALFEWGVNWVIATTANQYLIVHAAVVERNGRAMVLPGEPGAGKSTLTAALIHRGWRLLSDELALLDPRTVELVALARPVSLKNESIGLIREFAPSAVFSELIEKTAKGTIAFLRPPEDSAVRVDERAEPGWIVFPRFETGAPATLSAKPRAEAFMEIAHNALNYSVLGEQGFDNLGNLVAQSHCFAVRYSDLSPVVRLLTDLADGV